MKSLIAYIAMLVFSASMYVFAAWSCISFILYLTKDKPFDWTVFWVMIGSTVMMLVSFFASIILKQNENRTLLKQGKKRWQQRMEQLRKTQSN